MDSKLIVFSMDGTDEHIGVIESETDTHYINLTCIHVCKTV